MKEGGPNQGNRPFDKRGKAPSRGMRPDGTKSSPDSAHTPMRTGKPGSGPNQRNASENRNQLLSRDDRSRQTPDNRSLQIPDIQSRQKPDNRSRQAPDNLSRQNPANRSRQKPDNRSRQAPDNLSRQNPDKRSRQAPDNRSRQAPDKRSRQAPDNRASANPYNRSHQNPDDLRQNGIEYDLQQNTDDGRHAKIVSVDRLNHVRKTHRKNTVSRALSMTLVVMLFLVVAAAAVLYITDYVAAKPNCAFVSTGTIEHSIGTTALIVRDEQTFTSSTEGTLAALALEGSRVSKDQALAMIIPDGLESTSASLNNAQQQIVELQRKLMSEGKGSGAQTICDEADSQILPIIKMIRSDSLNNSLSNLISYSSSIQVLMDTRDSALQNIDFQDEQLNTLIAGKVELENTLSTQAATLSAAIPGIVSYKLDGLEGILNTTVITEMTPEQYYEYLEKSKGTISNDLAVKKDEAALRICQNAEQYLVTIVKGYSVTDFPVDASVNIRVPSEGVVIENCRIVRAVQSTGGVFIVMQTGSQVERLLDRRTAEIEIIRSSNTGLRVPTSALVNADYKMGYAEVIYNSSGYAAKLTVTVVDHDREYAIIAPVEATPNVPDTSTIIITNPDTIKVGDKIE